MSRRTTGENELRALFEEIEAPPGLDRWRERLAEPTEPEHPQDAVVLTPTPERWLRREKRSRSLAAVAAVAAVVVGLGGAVVASRFLSEQPPADPVIIDGPDRTASSPPKTSDAVVPPTGSVTAPPDSATGAPNGTGPNDGANEQDGQNDGGGGPDGGGTEQEPSWGPMQGDPSADNTGVPASATLSNHPGDLVVSTPGAIVKDVRVTGAIVVTAPNVTLRRVQVVANNGAAVQQNATGLSIEDSELYGGRSVVQNASGLTITRSRLESGVTISGRATLVDNFLNQAAVLITSGAGDVTLRHNTTGTVTMDDYSAPITRVTLENNLLVAVDAPTAAGSASIHVLNNRFRETATSTGWNPQAPDFQWSGNTFASSGAVANP